MTAEQLRMSIINEAFTGDWESVSLGEVCVHENGDRGKNYPSKDKLGHEGIPFISALNLANNTIIDDDKLFKASEVQFNNLRSGHLKKGDFVVCIRGSIGKHGIYPFEKGAIASSLVILRPDENKLSLMWLSYYFDSGLFQDSLSESQNGTAQPNLGAKELMKFELPLPPLAEQKRIVAKLEELLPIVEQYGKAQKELDELNAALPARLRQSILQEAISGKLVPQDENDEPVDILFNHIQEEKLKLIKQNIIRKKEAVINAVKEDEIPFDIPSSWKWCHLEELVAILDGYRKPVSKHDREVGTYPYYGANGVLDYVRDYIFDGEYLLVGEDGSVITSYGNPIVNKASGKIWVNNHAHVLQECGKLGYYDYLFYALQAISIKKYIHGFMPKYSQGDLRKTMIPLPPLAEQERIVAKIEELFAEIDKLK